MIIHAHQKQSVMSQYQIMYFRVDNDDGGRRCTGIRVLHKLFKQYIGGKKAIFNLFNLNFD